MDKVKDLFLSLYKDKHRFFLVLVHFSLGFLFYIGLYFTFLKDPNFINNGRVSMADFPGSFIYELLIFLTVFGYLFLMLVKKDAVARKVLLIQVILGTLVHLYGALLYRFGSEGTTTGGFGRIYLFILLVLMWVTYFKKDLVSSVISKFVPEGAEADVEEADVEEDLQPE